jgi:hypothetical protein
MPVRRGDDGAAEPAVAGMLGPVGAGVLLLLDAAAWEEVVGRDEDGAPVPPRGTETGMTGTGGVEEEPWIAASMHSLTWASLKRSRASGSIERVGMRT